jgi:hypothetical protein
MPANQGSDKQHGIKELEVTDACRGKPEPLLFLFMLLLLVSYGG